MKSWTTSCCFFFLKLTEKLHLFIFLFLFPLEHKTIIPMALSLLEPNRAWLERDWALLCITIQLGKGGLCVAHVLGKLHHWYIKTPTEEQLVLLVTNVVVILYVMALKMLVRFILYKNIWLLSTACLVFWAYFKCSIHKDWTKLQLHALCFSAQYKSYTKWGIWVPVVGLCWWYPVWNRWHFSVILLWTVWQMTH